MDRLCELPRDRQMLPRPAGTWPSSCRVLPIYRVDTRQTQSDIPYEFGSEVNNGSRLERGDPLGSQRCKRYDHRDYPPGWLSAGDHGELRERRPYYIFRVRGGIPEGAEHSVQRQGLAHGHTALFQLGGDPRSVYRWHGDASG